jgi:hypothetical protein
MRSTEEKYRGRDSLKGSVQAEEKCRTKSWEIERGSWTVIYNNAPT